MPPFGGPLPTMPPPGGAPGGTPGEGLPPSLRPAPPNSGPATAPHGNPGNSTQALSDIRQALELLQKALPGVPMGTKMHDSIMSSIKNVGAGLTEMQDSPQMKLQNLMQMMQQIKARQPNQALAALGAPGGAPGGPPGGAPPSPPNLGGPPPQAMAA